MTPNLSYDYEGEKRKAKIINGMEKKKRKCMRDAKNLIVKNVRLRSTKFTNFRAKNPC